MSDYIDARARYRSARTTTVASHKYDVGSLVAHKPGAAAERGTFRVTRHLPDGGQGLQDPHPLRTRRTGARGGRNRPRTRDVRIVE